MHVLLTQLHIWCFYDGQFGFACKQAAQLYLNKVFMTLVKQYNSVQYFLVYAQK